MSYPFTHVHDSATISNTEYFLASDSTSASYQTTAGVLRGWIDFSAMTAAETYDVKAYEKVNGSAAKLRWQARLVGVQAELFELLPQAVSEGWEISVTKVAGTDRSIGWALNHDVGDVNATGWNGLATVALPLVPTVAGRTLDVSAGGEAGIDFANIGSPTTTQNLSGTTVKTATDVEADTQDLQSRTPAALGANGNMKADIRDILGTASAAPTVAGILRVEDAVTQARLTSTRAGYLDNLSVGAVAQSSDISTLLTRLSALRAGYLDNLSAGAVAQASALSTAQSDITTIKNAVDTEIGTIITTLASLSALLGTPAADIAADIAAIYARLGAPAGASVSADVAGVQTKLGAPAGASVSADIAAVKGQVNTIDGKVPALVGGNVPSKVMVYDTAASPDKLVWESLPADVGTVEGSYGELVSRPAGAVVADAGNTASTFKTNLVSTDANTWKDAFLCFLDGDLAGQVHKVTASAATGFVTFTSPSVFTTAPTADDRFILINK